MDPNQLRAQYHASLASMCDALVSPWEIRDRGPSPNTWRHCVWTGSQLPEQGWKIHITCAPIEALQLLRVVVPHLISAPVTFKLPASVDGIVFINSGMAGESQLGKVITVYPTDAEQAA